MEKLSVIFTGTGNFGTLILEALAKDKKITIPFVITGQDKSSGRHLKMSENPLKKAAKLNKLFIQQPQSIKELKQKLMQERPDFLLVVAYGEIIPKEILEIPKYGSVNIHASLLPKYRGASPIQESLLNEDKKTGISWILMNEKMDQGPVVAQMEIIIAEEDTYETLSQKLSQLAAKHTTKVLHEFANTDKKTVQHESHATYCRKISKKDGFIDVYKENAPNIINKIRAYTPWPGCYIFWHGKRLKIIQAKIDEETLKPGEIKILDNKNLVIGTKNGAFKPLIVQKESKRQMAIEEFLHGQKQMSPLQKYVS